MKDKKKKERGSRSSRPSKTRCTNEPTCSVECESSKDWAKTKKQMPDEIFRIGRFFLVGIYDCQDVMVSKVQSELGDGYHLHDDLCIGLQGNKNEIAATVIEGRRRISVVAAEVQVVGIVGIRE